MFDWILSKTSSIFYWSIQNVMLILNIHRF
uniref:Uncharacterized protein n=1 Tax=Arundo donax TaxID=35708 RepID=A0A0A9HW71_ARUDO